MSYNIVICTLFVLLNIISPVFSLICSRDICYGSFAYCCGMQCCYHGIYTLWWFWLIWVFIMIGIVTCCFRCIQRRHLSSGSFYLLPDNTSVPRYGTTVVLPRHAYPATQPQPPCAYPATQPQPPPAYPATQRQPPPAYPATQPQPPPAYPATQPQPPPAYPATQPQLPPAYPATQHQITSTAPKYDPNYPHKY